MPEAESAEGVASPAPSARREICWRSYAVGEGAIKRIALGGGAAVTLCPAGNPFGLTWGPGGIVFGQS